jgi:uncharacterized protein (TIGR03435 family)
MNVLCLRTIFVGLMACALGINAAHAQAFPMNLGANDTPAAADVKVPAFDVASIKQNKGDSGMMRVMTKPDGFSCENSSLKDLISNAYGVRQDLISGGPGWVESLGFDIDAKVAGPDVETLKKLSPRQRGSMLQSLLEERFKLKVHRETKVLPIYDLVIAKGGSKLKEVPAADLVADAKDPDHGKHPGMMTMGSGMFKGQALPAQSIANEISYVLEHTVVDKTGLLGKYDLDLMWKPEGDATSADDGSAESGVSIFTAVQEQLGLKLLPTKGPVQTLVIDHVEQSSEN